MLRRSLLWLGLGAVALAIGLAREQGQATGQETSPAIRRLEAALVGVGQKAPAFEVAAVGGGSISLAEANRGKPVLLSFWFYG